MCSKAVVTAFQPADNPKGETLSLCSHKTISAMQTSVVVVAWGWYDHFKWCVCLSPELGQLLQFQLFSSGLDLSALWKLNQRPILENHKTQLHKFHFVIFLRQGVIDEMFHLSKQRPLGFYKRYYLLFTQALLVIGSSVVYCERGDLDRELYLTSCLHSLLQGGAFQRVDVWFVLIQLCSIKELFFFLTTSVSRRPPPLPRWQYRVHMLDESLWLVPILLRWICGGYKSKFYSKKFGASVKVTSGLNILYVYVIGVKLPRRSAEYP